MCFVFNVKMTDQTIEPTCRHFPVRLLESLIRNINTLHCTVLRLDGWMDAVRVLSECDGFRPHARQILEISSRKFL